MSRFIHYITACILLCMLSAGHIFAHVGGHNGDKHLLHEWVNTKTGAKIYASFLTSGKNGNVLVEEENGMVISLLLSELSMTDRVYVLEKQEMIDKLNMGRESAGATEANSTVSTQAASVIVLSVLLLSLLGGIYGVTRFRKNRRMLPALLLPVCLGVIFYAACNKSATDPSGTTGNNNNVTTAASAAEIINKAFSFFTDKVSTHWDDNYFYVESGGFPEHNMMVGITNWQQQVPIPHAYTGSNAWSIPLFPEVAETPISTKTNFLRGAVGIAANGIPIFNAYNNRGEDANLIGEPDNWGGHCGMADDYHYHTAPLHLQNIVGNQVPIAWALDGFAVYGATEPDGTPMTTLDENNGHTWSDGRYHYHGTTTYPYMIGAMVGKVTIIDGQVDPQASTKGVRPALTPLNGAVITGFSSTGTNAYSLEYTLNNEKYYINYNWTESGLYTFEFVDPQGNKTTETYQR